MTKNCDKNGDITYKGYDSPNQAHFRALTNTHPVKNAKCNKHTNGNPCSKWANSWKYHAEVEHAREATDGGSEEVIHQDEHTSKCSHPVIHSLRSYSHDTATLRKTIGHLSIFQC